MSDRPVPHLSFRLGCPLALGISISLLLSFAAAVAWLRERPFDLSPWHDSAWELAALGAPFFILAIARASDWLAWLLAILLTVSLYAYELYDMSLHRGVNFLSVFVLMFVAPVVISGLCLVVAGLRGSIPWARE